MQSYDPTDILTQERARAALDTRTARDQETDEADLKWLMDSKRGRRIVWRQLDRAGVFRLSFHTDAMVMAFAEGNRNEGLHILAQVHALCPDRYLTMVKEHARHERNTDDASR